MDDRAATSSRTDEEAGRRLDAEAVSRTLAGQTLAYDGLIEKYQRRAVAVAYRLLGNIEDAKDVCQEAFLRAFRSLASLQERERFGAWLMRIVTNLSLNYRRGRRPSVSLTGGGEGGGLEDRAVNLSPRGTCDAAAPLQEAETRQAVTAAIESLPEQQRLALILFAIERLPQKEIAEILDCSVEMVKWNVFQARKKLRETLGDYIED
jgi:RNA polymerase sigma-70 factor (ECF subfamily)